jgi:hypothetical protein
MIHAEVFKLETSGIHCANSQCLHNPEYHYNILGHVFHIKQGTTCLYLEMGGKNETYCRDCIDVVYKKLKPVLDSKLWILT